MLNNVKITLCFLCFFLIMPSYSLAGSCDTTIRKGNATEDLSRIFNCLNNRLNDLEVKINSLADHISGGVSIINPTSFDNGTIQLIVRGYSRENNFINIAVRIVNRTTEPLYLALCRDFMPELIDEITGKRYPCHSQGQMKDVYHYNKKVEDYTLIPRSGFFTLGLKFELGRENNNKNNEKQFTLNLSFYELKNDKTDRHTAPLAITLQ